MSDIKVISRTQKIIVNPATSSVSVINAGPQGPPGKMVTVQGSVANAAALPIDLVYADVGKGWITLDDGHLLIWTSLGFSDVGPFKGPTGAEGGTTALTVDGNLLTRIAGLPGEITRANLANDTAFTSKYPTVVNHGSVAATARPGTAPVLWIGSVDPTNATNDDELFRTDTVVLSKRVGGVWVVVSGSIFVGNSAPTAPTDGKLWWDTDDVSVVPPLTPADLAVDSAFTSRFPRVVNHGATAGTARNGTAPIFWIGSVNPTNATDNDELYRTDQTAKYIRVGGAWIEVGSSRYVSSTVVPWIPLLSPGLLGNGWVPVAGGYLLPAYRKIGDKVEVRGQIKSGTGGVAAFTLPAGHLPPGTFTIMGDNNGAATVITITSSGEVRPVVTSFNFGINFSFSVTA
jgi:hypothetical protein